MEQKLQKMNFFKRLKIAIFHLEKYGEFLLEKWQVAFIYFIILVFIMSVATAGSQIYNICKMIPKGISYIENDLPDFKFENNTLKFDRPIEAYDEEFKFRLFIDTAENQSKSVEQYKDKFREDDSGILLFNDRAFFVVDYGISGMRPTEFKYGDYEEYISKLNITDKASLKEYIEVVYVPFAIFSVFLEIVLINFIGFFVITILMLMATIAFGYIASFMCGIRMKYKPMFVLAVYSSSLSILLCSVYYVVNTITGFTMNHYDLVYSLISYVYMIAAILMIKYDLIKQGEILVQMTNNGKEEKTKEEENKETNEKKESEENKKSEEPKEDNDSKEEGDGKFAGNEPDGSEI
ncbi:MAG: DUF1189 domain-containing protein [Clostridia bacterium]|nr:DUF1189 domain-containing protein [Clostridia bacterium]